jgi:hypothetical protein
MHVVGSGTDCVVSARPKTADGDGAPEQPDVHALEEARRLVGSPIRLLTRSGRTNGACVGVAFSVVVRLASSVGAASRSAEQARGASPVSVDIKTVITFTPTRWLLRAA